MKSIKLKLLLNALEIIVALIASKVLGVMFFETYFYTALAVRVVVLICTLLEVGYKETMFITLGAVALATITMSLDFLLPWLISIIFGLEFFKTFTVTYLILSFISVIITRDDKE